LHLDLVNFAVLALGVWVLLGALGTYRAIRRRYTSLLEAFEYEPIGFVVTWLVYPAFLGPIALLLDLFVWHVPFGRDRR
jgi:hypothetical protein